MVSSREKMVSGTMSCIEKMVDVVEKKKSDREKTICGREKKKSGREKTICGREKKKGFQR